VNAQAFESHKVRSADKILPSGLNRGAHYRVEDQVVAYGFMNHFVVESDFGRFEVTGNVALRKMLREISAIAALKKVSSAEAVGDAAKQAVKSPFIFAKRLINDPVDTVSGLPEGVAHILGNVTKSVTMKHDPSEDSRIKQALFVSSWKRDFAHEHGVDVYSSNKVLQKELNRVGWFAAISSLSISAATMSAGTAVTIAKNMRLANQIGNALKEEPPSGLRVINEKKLSAMGVSKSLAERFLDHLAYTPRHDTIIVEALAQMRGTKGRTSYVRHILAAQGEVDANFFQQMTETLLGYYNKVSPLREISIVDGMVVALAENGRVLIPFPLDYGVWTPAAQEIVDGVIRNRRTAGTKHDFDLWVTGTTSALAKRQLANRGVKVTENVDKKIGFLE
jgi:hypothetical protein